ncbi:helix-turn-helix domain-containing protein [Clostridium cuniculi]|jgi:YesN/AraC family two-component response regulator|uniref:helix-turn-helix domain-containing protein n=1 Tax=Clostridium cuniculi TaxID=2548455 RepID=UPI0018AB5A8D|nr:AraC family transcriptional regulator [Clostridium cuniculi]
MIEHDIQTDFCNLIYRNLDMKTIHPPYDQELKELYCIENGDFELLQKILPKDYDDSYNVILANNPIRHIKNLAIIVVTLSCRAAIRGGITPEISFSLSDTYINKIESLDDYNSIEKLMRQSQYEYAKLVNNFKNMSNKNSNKNQNLYIEQCKDYIFSHLHDKIKIPEIASKLSLNPNYLSVLFRKHEGISIKEFIINEKIKIVKNLLTHSEYSYIEISNCMSFSSQSHLEKQFKKMTGSTLREYREKYYLKKFTKKHN